jgi:hypothetical protein
LAKKADGEAVQKYQDKTNGALQDLSTGQAELKNGQDSLEKRVEKLEKDSVSKDYVDEQNDGQNIVIADKANQADYLNLNAKVGAIGTKNCIGGVQKTGVQKVGEYTVDVYKCDAPAGRNGRDGNGDIGLTLSAGGAIFSGPFPAIPAVDLAAGGVFELLKPNKLGLQMNAYGRAHLLFSDVENYDVSWQADAMFGSPFGTPGKFHVQPAAGIKASGVGVKDLTVKFAGWGPQGELGIGYGRVTVKGWAALQIGTFFNGDEGRERMRTAGLSVEMELFNGKRLTAPPTEQPIQQNVPSQPSGPLEKR